MFGKKYLDKEDKQELYLRQQQINAQKMIVEGLELLKRNWFLSKFPKYNLDPSKNYSVNPYSGQIKEIKDKKNEHTRD